MGRMFDLFFPAPATTPGNSGLVAASKHSTSGDSGHGSSNDSSNSSGGGGGKGETSGRRGRSGPVERQRSWFGEEAEPHHADELSKYRTIFLSNIAHSKWFAGFDSSNISGALLSEYFQRHRDNPANAAAGVSGAGADTLQQIVKNSPSYDSIDQATTGTAKASSTAASAESEARAEELARQAADADAEKSATVAAVASTLAGSGNRRGRSLSAHGWVEAVYFPLGFTHGTALPVLYSAITAAVCVATEIGCTNHPMAMAALAATSCVVHLLSVAILWKVLGSILMAAMCTLDCDGDGNVWGLDPMDDTKLCVELGITSMEQNEYVTVYIQPRIQAVVAESWAAVPMALCMCGFIVMWLLADFVHGVRF